MTYMPSIAVCETKALDFLYGLFNQDITGDWVKSALTLYTRNATPTVLGQLITGENPNLDNIDPATVHASDSNAFMHWYDNTNTVYRRVSETYPLPISATISDMDIDGDYDGATNLNPDSVGIIGHDRGAAPDKTAQNIRITGSPPTSDAITPTDVHASDSNSFLHWYDSVATEFCRVSDANPLPIALTNLERVDDALFTVAVDKGVAIGGVFTADVVDANDFGVFRITAQRDLCAGIFDAAGNRMPAGDDPARLIYVRQTDGANLMPMGDNVARRIFVTHGDGTNEMPSGDDAARPIITQLSDGAALIDIGQETKANSLPVTLASDEDTVTVDGEVDVDIMKVGGTAHSATNPVFAELTDGANVVSDTNPLNVQIGDGTNQAQIVGTSLQVLRTDEPHSTYDTETAIINAATADVTSAAIDAAAFEHWEIDIELTSAGIAAACLLKLQVKLAGRTTWIDVHEIVWNPGEAVTEYEVWTLDGYYDEFRVDYDELVDGVTATVTTQGRMA